MVDNITVSFVDAEEGAKIVERKQHSVILLDGAEAILSSPCEVKWIVNLLYNNLHKLSVQGLILKKEDFTFGHLVPNKIRIVSKHEARTLIPDGYNKNANVWVEIKSLMSLYFSLTKIKSIVYDETSDYDVILGIEERGRIMSFQSQRLQSRYQQEMRLVSPKRLNTIDQSINLATIFEEYDPYINNGSQYKAAVLEFNKLIGMDTSVIILPAFAKLEYSKGVDIDIYTNHNFCFVTVYFHQKHAYPKYTG